MSPLLVDTAAAAAGEPKDSRTREERIADYMKKHKEQERDAERLQSTDERDRGYNASKRDYQEVSEEEMEAYRLARVHAEDPMAAFMSK